jgi:hypothetical protein
MHAQVKELCKLSDIKWKLKNLIYIYIFRAYFINFYVGNILQNCNLKVRTFIL